MEDNLNKIIETIQFACIDLDNLTIEEYPLLARFVILTLNSYILVPWPESQDYMEEDWFRSEAILDVNSTVGSGAYFIPLKRIL